MRRPFIAANWKMNKTIKESIDFLDKLIRIFPEPTDRDIIIAPPFTALHASRCAVEGTDIRISAQNLYWESEGAFTGEISAAMLVESGCEYVIIGHSERRHLFHESNENVNRKIVKALQADLKPIFCIGETLDERESDQTYKIIEKQLKEGLNNISSNDIQKIVVAYEPVWAIGTGRTAEPEQANEVQSFVRNVIKSKFGESASEITILYGGSVNPGNIDGIMFQPDIDGVLVGGASLNIDSFIRIINFQAV
jgi:triosephosphate isomerase